MYKKIIKIKKIIKTYSSPEEEAADAQAESADTENGNYDTVSTSYGETINMDIPFFVKLLEHVHTRVTTLEELQTLAQSVLTLSKTTPCLTLDEFIKLRGY